MALRHPNATIFFVRLKAKSQKKGADHLGIPLCLHGYASEWISLPLTCYTYMSICCSLSISDGQQKIKAASMETDFYCKENKRKYSSEKLAMKRVNRSDKKRECGLGRGDKKKERIGGGQRKGKPT